MLRARDFRASAREALKGKWGVAVLTSFVATLLTGGVSLTASMTGEEGYLSVSNYSAFSTATTIAIVLLFVAIIVGGAVTLGWSYFHLGLVKGEEVRFSNLFSFFDQLFRGFCMQLALVLLYILWLIPCIITVILWALQLSGLLYSPGVSEEALAFSVLVGFLLMLASMIPYMIAVLRYSMVPFLMAEFDDLRVTDALRESARLMKGNKWRLYCLNLSFFGWLLLSVLTGGIGSLWVTPYMQTAIAAFYIDVTGRSQSQSAEPGQEPWEQSATYIEPPMEF